MRVAETPVIYAEGVMTAINAQSRKAAAKKCFLNLSTNLYNSLSCKVYSNTNTENAGIQRLQWLEWLSGWWYISG